MKWILIFVFFFLTTGLSADERPISLQDLIQGALNIVKPIFDPSQPLRDMDSPMIPRVGNEDPPIFEDHQQAALGVDEEKDVVKNIPICRGDSKICKFIACAAHNFKHDESFANLNFAAQLISDKKIRKTIINNPDSVISVCREQGLSEDQCRLFSQGFQVVDRFITVIEPKDTVDPKESYTSDPTIIVPSESEADPPKISRIVKPIGKSARSSAMGSRTWSTHSHRVLSSTDVLHPKPSAPEVLINHKTTDEKKFFFNPKFSTSPIHVPTATVPVRFQNSESQKNRISQRPKSSKNQNFGFSLDEENLILARPKRDTVESDFEDFEISEREKRDYYDQVESSGQDRGTLDSDYYENVEEKSKTKKNEFIPMNCFGFLG